MMKENLSPVELLQFYADIGIDDPVGDEPVDRYKVTETIVALTPAITTPLVNIPDQPQAFKGVEETPLGSTEALSEAKEAVAAAKTLDELKATIENFKGLAIKRTATQIVFCDGKQGAPVMLIGEAPGADEDRIGRPFVGTTGHLMDKMLAAINLSRDENIYITNVVNWRPPGNRAPTDAEIAISLPFLLRHIELAKPSLIILAGGVAAKAVMDSSVGINRLRGKWVDFSLPELKTTVPLMPMLHPGYLLRSPQQKALAWADLLKIRAKLKELGLGT